MKKCLAWLLVLVIMGGLAACSPTTEPEEDGQYSWLVGEWGSRFITEEASFTLREDGTCLYDGQEGQWTTQKQDEALPKVLITVEEKEVATLSFTYQPYMETYLCQCPLADSSDESDQMINRSQFSVPEEVMDYVTGRWYDIGGRTSSLMVSASGACRVNGEDGVWCWDARLDSDVQSGVELLVKLTSGSYRYFIIHNQDTADGSTWTPLTVGQNTAYIGRGEGFDSIVFPPVTRTAMNMNEIERVTITKENFKDYFEIAYSSTLERDENGRAIAYHSAAAYKLQAQYENRLVMEHSKVEVEIECWLQAGYLDGTFKSNVAWYESEEGKEKVKQTSTYTCSLQQPTQSSLWSYGCVLSPEIYATTIDSEETYYDIYWTKIQQASGILYLVDKEA